MNTILRYKVFSSRRSQSSVCNCAAGRKMNLIFELLWLIVIIIYAYVEALVKLFIPVKRKSVSGETVLITGAGHGIGRLTAYEFAKRQSKLVLWDLNKHGVEETAEGCKKLGAKVHAFVVDCSIKEEIYTAAEKIKRDIGDVSILVNNAGVVAAADLLSTQDKQIQKTFEVNILAHHWVNITGIILRHLKVGFLLISFIMFFKTTKAFLPAMMKNNHGHIVTVASAGGHIAVPFLVSY
ncbi:hypothetical protein JD844_026378 [Phrynosoma platyrhinos]|uniref:Estradiol 17-beta-dehydrogenase 11 n=1 Tax=Phrynosoma platyrhinos TaxID=52577 RepID=A0ABQ7SEQ1_PHRPL|nr:hypothetical protein JD844_026378 [Phrynosoma platyrhinos]